MERLLQVSQIVTGRNASKRNRSAAQIAVEIPRAFHDSADAAGAQIEQRSAAQTGARLTLFEFQQRPRPYIGWPLVCESRRIAARILIGIAVAVQTVP